jgi:receptor expression-enhancing protein 5/6
MRAAAARRRLAHLVDVTSPTGPSSDASDVQNRGGVVVVGGMVLDVQACPAPGSTLMRGTTAPGRVRQTPGGVGRNIAEGLVRALPSGAPAPFLISAVGDDLAGNALLDAWKALGISSARQLVSADGVRVCAGASTPTVAAVLDAGGEVAAAVADCDTVEKFLDPRWIERHAETLNGASVVVLDGNCAKETLSAAVAATAAARTGNQSDEKPPWLWFEPVSVSKSTRAFEADIAHALDVVSPNLAELRAMASAARGEADEENRAGEPSSTASVSEVVAMARHDVDALLDAGITNIVLTLGALGVVLCHRNTTRTNEKDEKRKNVFLCTHVPALPARVRSLVGAGDALVAGCAAALSAGHEMVAALAVGVALARRAVETDANVPSGPGVSFQTLQKDALDAARGATSFFM